MWYLHAPDRTVPYEITLKAVNELYKEGKFKRFGISNYMSYVSTHVKVEPKANSDGRADGKSQRSSRSARPMGTSNRLRTRVCTTLSTGTSPSLVSFSFLSPQDRND